MRSEDYDGTRLQVRVMMVHNYCRIEEKLQLVYEVEMSILLV